MHPFRRLRLMIKKRHVKFYSRIRSVLLPFYLAIQSNRHHFTGRKVKEVSHHGKRFLIALDQSNGFVDTTIFTDGVYEPDILDVIYNHLKPGDTFVDIGANIGQHSLFAATIVGDQGRVLSFEPIPAVIAQLKESVALNNFGRIVEAVQTALGAETEQVKLFLREGNVGGSSIAPFLDSSNSTSITINVHTGDELLLHTGGQINLIKIDTEGYEPQVIQGLKRTLALKRPVIILEYSPIFWKNNPERTGRSMLETLQSLNYSLFDLEDEECEILNITDWTRNFEKSQTNILCVQKK